MFLFLDTETTHPFLNKQKELESRPNIVQLAYMCYDKEKKFLGSGVHIIKSDGWKISPGAENVHGISLEECNKHGVELRVAMCMFNAYAKMSEYIICHNTKFDYSLLESSYERIGKLDDFPRHLKKFCTMESAKDIVKAKNVKGWLKNPRLDETFRFVFNKDFDGAHDAMCDTTACRDIFFELFYEGVVNE